MSIHKTTVAIIGGTGKIGTHLVGALVDRGYHVKLLVRDAGKFKIESELVTLVSGDARNAQSIYNLIQGCSVLINTIGQPKGEPPLFSLVAANIIRALTLHNVKRYFVVAGLGLETPRDKKRFAFKLLTKTMHFLFPAIMNDKKEEYRLISASDLDWSIFRIPRVVMSKEKKGVKVDEFDCPGMTIHVVDLVGFLINQISETNYIKKAPFVAN